MNDRDSIRELYAILKEEWTHENLPLARGALRFIEKQIGQGYDIFYRRRLSVCRTISDLHLPIPTHQLDVMLLVTLLHHLPGDHIPEEHDRFLLKVLSADSEAAGIMATLKQTNYQDQAYYERLKHYPQALIIRLSERSVLVEKLYEWSPSDSLHFILETRLVFFPLCLYAKEEYPEYLGAINILHEKMKTLTTVNEMLLTKYVAGENALSDEILSLREENAILRAMIAEQEYS